MIVEDFCGVQHEVFDQRGLEGVFMQRHGDGANEFALSHGRQRYPAIVVAVKGDLAALHYFPSEGHPGFRATGNLAGLEPLEMTTFWITAGGETIEVLNDAVMPFAVALTAAKEFLANGGLPRSVEWFEL